jgi:transposase
VGHAAAGEAVAQKKSLAAGEQRRPDVQAEREVFFEQFKDVRLSNVVVLDESYATTKFTRLYGRFVRGARLVGRVPHGHWKLLTIIAAMTVEGVVAAASIDASTDADVFRSFVTDALVPALRPGQVVVTDKLAAHKVASIRAAIEAASCRVLYLPPYSPDFSPIEPMWSKVKQTLRTISARTVGTLGDAISTALQAITPSDCQGYFRHCGYTL